MHVQHQVLTTLQQGVGQALCLQPLFPTIMKAGICKRAMLNSRVTIVIKGMSLELACRCPNRLSAQEAKSYSAKSLCT